MRTPATVPGSTVLRRTTVWGSTRPRNASPMVWPVRTTASTSSAPPARLGVPTQMSDNSEAATALSPDVVARRRRVPTTSASSSGSPGSITGERAAFTIETFSALTSTPITSCPAFARQAAVTQPTYPSPKTLTRIGDHLMTPGFEFGRDLRPRVSLLDKPSPGGPERPAPGGIPQQGRPRPSKLRGSVGPQEMRAGNERKALGAHRRRHDAFGHRERFEDLETRSPADPQRHHVDSRFRDVGADVVHRSRDPDARLPRRLHHTRRWIPPRHRHGHLGDLATD